MKRRVRSNFLGLGDEIAGSHRVPHLLQLAAGNLQRRIKLQRRAEFPRRSENFCSFGQQAPFFQVFLGGDGFLPM